VNETSCGGVRWRNLSAANEIFAPRSSFHPNSQKPFPTKDQRGLQQTAGELVSVKAGK
jgi:hypothetical protein